MGKYFEKTALNASKLRELADKAGIVVHPTSQWQWAVRQLRSKNPKGLMQEADELLLKGKDLAKAKEKIGLLPNNEIQEIRSAVRKNPEKEVGTYDTESLRIGNRYSVSPKGEDVIFVSHTHPDISFSDKFLYKKSKKPILNMLAKDKVINAAPSGIAINRTDKEAQEYMKLSKEERKSRDSVSKSPELPDSVYGGDAFVIRERKQRNNKHVILTSDITGVHKFNPKFATAFRSVYFNKGVKT